jgi:hypothetical protein
MARNPDALVEDLDRGVGESTRASYVEKPCMAAIAAG